jgi:hypothetical protein
MDVWHDRNNRTHVETGMGRTECVEMAMTRRMQYHWNPMEETLCIEAFTDDDVSEDIARLKPKQRKQKIANKLYHSVRHAMGYSCNEWAHGTWARTLSGPGVSARLGTLYPPPVLKRVPQPRRKPE